MFFIVFEGLSFGEKNKKLIKNSRHKLYKNLKKMEKRSKKPKFWSFLAIYYQGFYYNS